MKKINIAIADDEELFRKGMRFLLERETNFNITYEAENGKTHRIYFYNKRST